MKRIVGFFIVLILSTGLYSVVAQNEQNDQSNDQGGALRQLVERNMYGDNWFISLGGSANLLAAEQDGFVPMTKRLKYGGAFTIGKWFNSNFGARIQVMGGSLRGFNNVNLPFNGYYILSNYDHSPYPLGGDPALAANASKYSFYTTAGGVKGFWQDFNYGTATLDLMSNFTNLVRGRYYEHNRFDVIPFAGLGYIHAFNNNVTTPNFNFFVLKIGFRLNINLNDSWTVYIEPQGNATEKELDGYSGTALGDGIVNLGLGIQYTFNKKFTTLTQVVQMTSDEVDRLNKKINDNRYLIDNHQNILERQQNLLDRLQKCCDDNKRQVVSQVVESPSTAITCLPEYVRFGLDSYKIELTESRRIAEVVDYLKKSPNSKLLVVGYADKKTGSARYNMNLSQKRVEAVVAELKNSGISANRIISEWKGDKEQPFPQNEWNRVVVMVERK